MSDEPTSAEMLLAGVMATASRGERIAVDVVLAVLAGVTTLAVLTLTLLILKVVATILGVVLP